MAVDVSPGSVIAGRYQLERVLGQGGMGVVWAAMHTVTRRRVALKFLKGPAHLRPELRKRFLREARAASAVVHPNVVQVHDVFELDDQTPVMVMDLLDGETLGQRIARDGALSVTDTANILVQVVSAVGTAHAVGVVHRDLKPDNVFLLRTTGGVPSVRVLDFGIAKLVGPEGVADGTGPITGTGAMLGTPCYMSPEQTFGEKDIDHRTDVWSLGTILYECLTGARPVEGDSMGQVVKRLVSGSITPITVLSPDLPADVVELVGHMLSRERGERPADLRLVLDVLARHATVKAPEFPAPGAERAPSESVDETLSSSAERVVVGSNADPSAETHQVPSHGPETAGAHTMSSPGVRRPSRAIWIAAAVVALASGWVLISRAPAHEPGAPSAGAAVPAPDTLVVTSQGKEPAKVAVPPAAGLPSALAPVVAPSVEPTPTAPEKHPKAPANASPRRVAGAPSAPAPSISAAPPRTAPPTTRLGGLAEKPPF